MIRELQGERRLESSHPETEMRGAIWSLPDGRRLPSFLEADPIVVGNPVHPARLLPTDLDDPQHFHSRLTAWLLRQG